MNRNPSTTTYQPISPILRGIEGSSSPPPTPSPPALSTTSYQPLPTILKGPDGCYTAPANNNNNNNDSNNTNMNNGDSSSKYSTNSNNNIVESPRPSIQHNRTFTVIPPPAPKEDSEGNLNRTYYSRIGSNCSIVE